MHSCRIIRHSNFSKHFSKSIPKMSTSSLSQASKIPSQLSASHSAGKMEEKSGKHMKKMKVKIEPKGEKHLTKLKVKIINSAVSLDPRSPSSVVNYPAERKSEGVLRACSSKSSIQTVNWVEKGRTSIFYQRLQAHGDNSGFEPFIRAVTFENVDERTNLDYVVKIDYSKPDASVAEAVAAFSAKQRPRSLLHKTKVGQSKTSMKKSQPIPSKTSMSKVQSVPPTTKKLSKLTICRLSN